MFGANGSKSRRGIFLLMALLLIVGSAAAVARWQTAISAAQSSQSSQSTPKDIAGQKQESDGEAYSADPSKISSRESENLTGIEDYWNTRVTYPTGKFDGKWLLQAAAQDKQVQERVPAGVATYNKGNGRSPLSLDPNAWTSLGPRPLQSDGCQGCYAYGHVSGRVNDIRVDPVDHSVAYIVPVGGGVWKTTNCCTANTTWTPVTDDPLISTVQVDDISIDPSNHNTIYVGTGDLNFGSFSMGSAGILKSTDAGATWAVKGADVFTGYYPEPPGAFPQYQAVGKIEADPRNSNTLVAGAKTGVFFSYNGGDNWTGPCLPDNYPTQRQDVTGLILSNNGAFTDMYVAVGSRGYSTTVQSNLAENGANGIYKSAVPSNGCPASWTLSSRPDNGWPAGTGGGIPVYQGGDTLGRVDLAIAPSNPNYIYAIVQAIGTFQGGVKGVWRSTDAGATWEQRAGLGSNSAEWQGCATTGQQNWYNQHITVDPNNPDVVLVDAIDIFKSTNGADTFNNITCGYNGGRVHVDQHALEYVPGSSSMLLTGSDGGVYVSLNADQGAPTFSQLNDTLSTIEFYSGDITANFATSNSPGINAGAQDNGSGVYVWPDNNVGPALWQLRKGGDGMYARIEPVLGQRWYQESQNGALAVSLSGAYGSQQSATGGWTGDSPRVSFVFPYEIYKYDCPPTGCTHMVAGSYRVWETVLGGVPSSSWYINSPDLTKNTLQDRSFINQLSYSVSLSTTAIVGTNDGNVQYGFNLGQGIASTATWVDVTGGNTVLPNRPILDVATDPVNPLVGYAAVGGFDQNTPATPGHVYQVTCNANCASYTWANKSGNLPNIPIDSIIANPRYPQQVFAGSDWGLYYTNDITAGSPAWYRFNTGMPNSMIWDMAIDRGFTTLAIFTRGRGAFAWPLPSGPFGGTPTPVATTPIATSTPTATSTRTSTPVAPSSTLTSVSSSTGTATPIATATATSISTSTAMATATTPASTATATQPAATATATSGQPTNTTQPTNTPTTGATNTSTSTAVPQLTPTPTLCPIQFTDVPVGSPFYPYIRCLACRGIVSGYPDGTFLPGNNVTRGQLAKIVSNSAQFSDPEGTAQTFEDVAPGTTFYTYTERLASRHVMSGYECNQDPSEPCVVPLNRPYFRPYSNATRGQIAKIISNAADFQAPIEGQTFEDVQPGSTFYTYTERLYAHGVISGYICNDDPNDPCIPPNNRPYYHPQSNATRGQTAKIVSNTFYPNCQSPNKEAKK